MQNHTAKMLIRAESVASGPLGARAAMCFIQGWTGEDHKQGRDVVYTSEDVCAIMKFLLEEGEDE